MLTSTTRDGGYRTSSYLGRRRRRHELIDGGGRSRGTSSSNRAWSRLATTTALTILGLVGAAIIVISPLVEWRVPVEVGGLALIGTSVAALLRQAVRL